jgi:1,4-dihydroxy-2-naphthoate octaprenyltransferase
MGRGDAGTTRWSRTRAGVRLTRPDQVLLMAVVYAVGCAAGSASEPGPVPVVTVLLVGVVVVAVAVSVHAVDEYADAGTDALTVRTRFSGGSGALAAHGLPAAFALRLAVRAALVAVVATAVGGASGVLPDVVVVMLVVGLVGGWAYSVGPRPFSRNGLGEIANAALGGLLLPATGAVVVGATPAAAFAALTPFSLLVLVNLLETQWADRVADRQVGKHTLASRLRPGRLRLLGGAVAVVAYVLAAVTLPAPVALAGLVAAPVSAYGVRRLGRGAPGPSVAAMVLLLVAQGTAWVVTGPDLR